MYNLRVRQVGTSSDSDGGLVEKIRRGDQRAFKELFRRRYAGLCRFAYRYIPSKDEVEDIVESVFEKLWLSRERLDPSKSIEAYLFKAVKNQALDILKGRAKDLVSLGDDRVDDSLASDPVKELINNDLAAALSCAIERLPRKCKIVFTLSRQENLTYSEIGEILGISEKTVENQMGRAFRLLRRHLKDFIG